MILPLLYEHQFNIVYVIFQENNQSLTLQEQFQERQQFVKEYIVSELLPHILTLPIYAEADVDFDFVGIVGPYLECMDEFQDPDFFISTFFFNFCSTIFIVSLVRYMRYTNAHNDLILPVLESVPLWLTEKEDYVSH